MRMNLHLPLSQAKYYPMPEDTSQDDIRPTFLDFFAGSGLVSYALKPYFREAWANDICPKKAAVFEANHIGAPFDLASITAIKGNNLPCCVLSWASFPCQDLSIAGNVKGINAKRSGLVWEWLRVMDEMCSAPPILVAENVVGLVSANAGANYKALHNALVERGYKIGAVLLDAINWLPQSRPRIFIIAVKSDIVIPRYLIANYPIWAHTKAIKRISSTVTNWIWWNIPRPAPKKINLSQLIDYSLPCHDEITSNRNINMIPQSHMRKLNESGLIVAPGYKRIRKNKQVLELRFDDNAGCLRTPLGGASRQYLVIKHEEGWRTRIISPREAARLMGAPDKFKLPGSFNDGYKAMGDAVAVPVVEYLGKHLLSPLAAVCNAQSC